MREIFSLFDNGNKGCKNIKYNNFKINFNKTNFKLLKNIYNDKINIKYRNLNKKTKRKIILK